MRVTADRGRGDSRAIAVESAFVHRLCTPNAEGQNTAMATEQGHR